MKCARCGKEDNEQWMKAYPKRHGTEWWCWECYLKAEKEAQLSDMYRGRRLQKICENKKVRK